MTSVKSKGQEQMCALSQKSYKRTMSKRKKKTENPPNPVTTVLLGERFKKKKKFFAFQDALSNFLWSLRHCFLSLLLYNSRLKAAFQSRLMILLIPKLPSSPILHNLLPTVFIGPQPSLGVTQKQPCGRTGLDRSDKGACLA